MATSIKKATGFYEKFERKDGSKTTTTAPDAVTASSRS